MVVVATVEQNVALMREAFARLDRGDLDATESLLTEDFIANLPGVPGPVHGRAVWRQGVRTMADAFPDLRTEVEDIFGAGDRVAVRLRFRGTHGGDFQGIPATQRTVEFTSVEIYRIADGRIAEEWVSPDMMGLMHQLTA